MLVYAVLAVLREGADHGYRLKRRLDLLLGPVWPTNAGQVYQVLARLRRAGWAEELPPELPRERGHERWPVALTRSGRTEFERWSHAPILPSTPPKPPRHELLARLALVGAPAARQVLRGIAAERAVYVRAHERVHACCGDEDRTATAAEMAQSLALEATCGALRAHLDWLDLCERRVRTLQE